MTQPVRLQLSRAKGFNLQAHSRAVNGLAAVNCARPSKWGNPFRVGFGMDAKIVVEAYRQSIGIDVSELQGKNLACWCGTISHGEYCPCHADVLLSIANDIPMEEVISENIRRAKGETL